MSRSTTRHAHVAAALASLQAAFPAAFPTDPAAVRPLALGVRATLEVAGIAGGRTPLHSALWRWCRQPAYLAALAEDRPRINLDGTDAGPVAPEHQTAAAAWLERLRAKAERRAAASVVPAAPVPEPAPEPAPVAPTGRPVLSLKKPLTKPKRKL